MLPVHKDWFCNLNNLSESIYFLLHIQYVTYVQMPEFYKDITQFKAIQVTKLFDFETFKRYITKK